MSHSHAPPPALPCGESWAGLFALPGRVSRVFDGGLPPEALPCHPTVVLWRGAGSHALPPRAPGDATQLFDRVRGHFRPRPSAACKVQRFPRVPGVSCMCCLPAVFRRARLRAESFPRLQRLPAHGAGARPRSARGLLREQPSATNRPGCCRCCTLRGRQCRVSGLLEPPPLGCAHSCR